MVGRGQTGHDLAWHGITYLLCPNRARQDEATPGVAWLGLARKGRARLGETGPGTARQGLESLIFYVPTGHGMTRLRLGAVRHGMIRPAAVRFGWARSGTAWHGKEQLYLKVSPDKARSGGARYDEAKQVSVWLVQTRLGLVRYGLARSTYLDIDVNR